MDDLAKRTAGTPLSPAELEQRRAAAQSRLRRIAAKRLLDARKAGNRIVYRGAPEPDFTPKPRGYSAAYVTREKGQARDYATARSYTGKQVGPSGFITAYALPADARLLDVHRLQGDPPATGDVRRLRLRHHAALMRRIGDDWGRIRREWRRGFEDKEAEVTPDEPDAILEHVHINPEEPNARFLRRRGYIGTSNGRSLALVDAKPLRPLYARYDGDTRKIVLAKRTAGTPLSPAELEQRRAAARARWAVVAASAAGTVASHLDRRRQLRAHAGEVAAAPARAAAAIDAAVQRRATARLSPTPGYPEGKPDLEHREERLRRRWIDRRKDVIAGALKQRKKDARTFLRRVSDEPTNLRFGSANLAVERAAHRARGWAILDMPPGPEREKALAAHLAARPHPPGLSGVARQVRHLTQEMGGAPAELAAIEARLKLDPFEDDRAPTGQESRELELRRRHLAARIDESRAERDKLLGARPRIVTGRAASTVTRRTAAWSADRKLDAGDELRRRMAEIRQTKEDHRAILPKLRELGDLRDKLAQRLASGEISQAKHDAGLRYIETDPVWARKKEIEGRPSFSSVFQRKRKSVPVPVAGEVGRTWTRSASPKARSRATLTREELRDVGREVSRRADHVAERAIVHAVRMSGRRHYQAPLLARYRAAIAPAVEAAHRIPAFHYKRNWALIGGAAALGGLGSWMATRPAKVEKLAGAPPDSTLRKSTPETPQDALSRRLAALFGTWTDEAEGRLLAPTATTLHADMKEGLAHALQPLDQVVRDGMTAEIPVDTGQGRNLAFTLQARSPAVASYVDQYRQSRIVALADEQKETIKAQLLDAATAGADPQAMALRIKQTIGLTPFQAGHVVNYLHELETLNPAALQRQLRDKRFDSTIQRAMEDGTVLSADYIQKVVDAYHRRYLAFRATTIANTEAVGAANNGQAAAAAAIEGQHPGFELEKEWIATDDERTRHDHAELNGQVVRGLDTPFQCASGDLIRWPHDPMAPARQVIRCRCSWVTRLVPRLRPDSAANLPQNS